MDGIHNPFTPTYSIATLISGIIGIFILIAFIMAFLYLIVGGINWITSGGDKTQLETARNRIINALIGLILVASIWAIISLLFPTLGLNFPNFKLPSIGGGLEKL